MIHTKTRRHEDRSWETIAPLPFLRGFVPSCEIHYRVPEEVEG